MTRFAMLALLGGCDALFGLKSTSAPPDTPPCGTPDEDGDCVADVDDNCPGIANASQSLSGEAATPGGAGDACDPEPLIAGNAVEYFSGFNAPANDALEWRGSQSGGGWTFADGIVQNMATGNFGYLHRDAVDDANNLAVEARFVFHGADSTALETRLGVLADFDPMIGGGEECWITANARRLFAQESTTANSIAVEIPALVDGDVVLLVMRRDRNAETLDCSATINGVRTTLPQVVSTAPWPTMEHVAIQARATIADLAHVTLYTR